MKWILTEPQADFRQGSVLPRDFDGDAKKEVVASGRQGRIWVFSYEGKLIWSMALPPGGDIDGAPNIFDVDRDGELEILAFCNSSGNRSGAFYCLDRWGKEEWAWRSTWCDGMHIQPTIGDLNGDGEYEIVIGLRNLDSEDFGGLVVLSFFGVELARKYLVQGVGRNVMLADIDEDGRVEILVGAEDGFYYCLGPLLEQRWAFNMRKITGPVAITLNPIGALGDVTGDGRIDVVFHARNNSTLYVLDGFGKLAAEPYSMNFDSTGSIALGDVEKDGASDILLCAGSALCCLTLGAPYRAATFVWPMFLRDSTNVGAVPIPEALTGWLSVLAFFVALRLFVRTIFCLPRSWRRAFLSRTVWKVRPC